MQKENRQMVSEKLSNMLSIIFSKLEEIQISCCVIGAMALGQYGHPRYTADIDLLAGSKDWKDILPVMEKLGYTCFQKTDAFAQFDSEMGVFGKVDFMLADTQDGIAMIQNACPVDDELFGHIQVIQPTDYIILKLMAIANNVDRGLQDEADISELLRLSKNSLLPDHFAPLDTEKIYRFAERFGQIAVVERQGITKKR
jgi:hypothetical protein